MESSYKPSAPISLMKSFGSSDEVSIYHIQWLMGKSLSPNVRSRKSVEFKAGHVELEDSTKIWLKWRFEYYIDEETKLNIIRLNRADDEEDEDAPDVPTVSRLAIMNKVTGITIHYWSHFLRSTIDLMYKYKLSVDDARELDFPNGNYVVYCWLDIPKKVFGGKPPLTIDPQGNFGSALLLSGVSRLFDEVVARKTDESKGTSDIVLITEKGKPRKERRFYCHRGILTVRSPVFETMLTSKRFKEGNARDVDIEDVTGDVLEIVLRYIYTGECSVSTMDFGTVRAVVDVAEKYMLPELKDECVREIIGRYNADNAWADYLSMSETYNIDYLKQISMLALSSNLRAMGDEMVREKLSDEAMAEVTNMAATRGERSKMMEVKNLG